MKLYLIRNRSGADSRFSVFDELGCCRFIVTGNRTAASDKMKLCDMDGNVLLTLRSTPFYIFHSFRINDGNERFSLTVNDFHRSCDFRFFGISWRMRRQSFKCFEVFDTDSELIMTQSPSKKHRDGAYELNIEHSSRELFCIAVAICADCVDYADSPQAATV